MALRRSDFDRLTVATFCVPIALFFLATLNDKAQAGIRYFLPIYPFVFLLCGAAAAYLWKRGTIFKVLMAVLLAWHAAEAVMVFPHHLAYFNELVGGPKNGYKYLRDSNLDWGQDLKGLAEFARKKDYPEIVLDYPWPAPPAYYQLAYRTARPEEMRMPESAVYAISVHALDNFEWAKTLKPDAKVGYSIFVYDMRKHGG